MSAPPIIGVTGFADQSARPPNLSTFAVTRTYVRAVEAAGGAPLILPPYLDPPCLRAAFQAIDGLILSGGGDVHPSQFGQESCGLLWRVDRQRDDAELMLARWALADRRPLLAICRGIQVLNVAAGGTLIQDIPTQVPDALAHSSLGGRPVAQAAHSVDVAAGSRLGDLIGAGHLEVNSAHHQAASAVADALVVSARAPDGVIEGLEARDHPFCVGVQWHPEVMIEHDERMLGLFQGLVSAVHG